MYVSVCFLTVSVCCCYVGPYRLKWHGAWLHDSFLSLDPELIEKNHGLAQKNMHRCVRAFEKLENEGCTKIASAIKEQVEDFKPHIPLISALRNPGMRERHWKELSSMIGIDIVLNESFTLTKVFSLGLGNHIEVRTPWLVVPCV